MRRRCVGREARRQAFDIGRRLGGHGSGRFGDAQTLAYGLLQSVKFRTQRDPYVWNQLVGQCLFHGHAQPGLLAVGEEHTAHGVGNFTTHHNERLRHAQARAQAATVLTRYYAQ